MEKIVFFLSVMLVFGCEVAPKAEINGITLVGERNDITDAMLDTVKAKTAANYVAIIPYAFNPGNTPEIIYNVPRQWVGERKAGIISQVEAARQNQLKSMIKPHLWVRHQGWAGELDMGDDASWEMFESNYRRYICEMAQLADSLDVEIFCLGTEMRKMVQIRPGFWAPLIDSLRQIYSGKITYAANWDNYQSFPCWRKLDFIGIDAYFPLDTARFPTDKSLSKAWEPIKISLHAFSKEQGLPILFTEYGYQSSEYVAAGHWVKKDKLRSDLNQKTAYATFFQTFWNEDWVAGGFLWKWFPSQYNQPTPRDPFSPQGKDAVATIRNYYSR